MAHLPDDKRRWRPGTTIAAAGIAVITALALAVPALWTRSQHGAAAPSCTSGTTVATADGPVCGTSADGVTSYQGVPYAAPPVGALRWRPPQPHQPWSTTLPATQPAKSCPEPSVAGADTSEDCLYLKIEKPADAKLGEHLPVMYEFHGGGFLGENRTDQGENLVRTGRVVYVYVGYRLGVLGFLAHAALGEHSGDYGLQDQQAGLRWVQRNITHFGGDPHNVTVFGESAGGASVCDQVASPTAKRLFQKGISVSGFYNYENNTIWSKADCKSTYYTESQAQRTGAQFAAKLGCDHGDVAVCLRKVPVATLVDKGGQFVDPTAGGTIGPIVNGTTLTMSPAKAFATGHVNHVSLITDVGRDEFNGGIYANQPGLHTVVADTPAQYRQLTTEQFGRLAPTVRRLYPLSRYSSPFIAYRTIMADSASVCPLLTANDNLARHIPLYADLDEDADNPAHEITAPVGAVHSGTNLLVHYPSGKLDPNQAALQDQLLAEWTSFARTGNPAAAHSPTWPRYDRQHQQVLSIRPAGASLLIPTQQLRDQHHCTFWTHTTHY
ncbi:carboxylesterase/lipase family protein [Actinocatenispora comari]|uniref:Carboxylic ester hydrolase n=1 Tax=Actinocatenispora comari TaxID=2807577 RepID=A0A8J4ELW4_9ACTN|nr:carboxylesterase family protein [Actinocatenispora comari]GIL28223.1 carboxylic ester hydrolase [Actinocatenispora comari]